MNDNHIHPATEKLAVLLLMQRQPDQPFTVSDLAEHLDYSWRHVQQILDNLAESGLVAQARMVSGGEMGYVVLTTPLE